MPQPRQSHRMLVTVTNGPLAPNANAVGASGNVLLLEEFHVVQWEEEGKRHAIGGCIPFINRDGAAFAAIKYRRVCRLQKRKQQFVTLRIVYRSSSVQSDQKKAADELTIDLWMKQPATARYLKEVMSDVGGQFEIRVDANTKVVSVNTSLDGDLQTGSDGSDSDDDDSDDYDFKHALMIHKIFRDTNRY